METTNDDEDSQGFFTMKRKDDKMMINILREAADDSDIDRFFHSTMRTSEQSTGLLLLIDTTAIKISPISINVSIMKRMYQKLAEERATLESRVQACAVVVSSKVLSFTVTKILQTFDLSNVAICLSHETSKCKTFLRDQRALAPK